VAEVLKHDIMFCVHTFSQCTITYITNGYETLEWNVFGWATNWSISVSTPRT